MSLAPILVTMEPAVNSFGSKIKGGMVLDTKNQNTLFCPACSTEREKPEFELPTLRFVWIAALWGLLVGGIGGLSVGLWFGVWAGVLGAVLSFIALEVYYTYKFRSELVCPVCRFDPILYRRSPEEAVKRCLEGLKGRDSAFINKWQRLRNQTAT